MAKKKNSGPSRRTLLSAWSKKVRDRDGNRCVVCGATKYLNAHHLLPKEKFPEFQYEVDNGISLCVSHHKWGKFSAHGNPIWFADWLMWHRIDSFDLALSRMCQVVTP